MKGAITLSSPNRAISFAASVTALVNDRPTRVYRVAAELFARLYVIGSDVKRASAIIRRARIKNGSAVFEEAAEMISPEGNMGWVWAVEAEIDHDLAVIPPRSPALISEGQAFAREGFRVSRKGNVVSVDTDAAFADIASSDTADAIDAALLSFQWNDSEGALFIEGTKAVRTAGCFRH